MPTKTIRSRNTEGVRQFSVFMENKVGRLLEVINLLAEQNIHVLALTTLDTSDSSIMRLVVDDPDAARELLREHAIAHAETDVLVVELDGAEQLQAALAMILQAEINIHYAYSFLTRPLGKPALVLHLEDLEIATQALMRSNYRILGQRDISR